MPKKISDSNDTAGEERIEENPVKKKEKEITATPKKSASKETKSADQNKSKEDAPKSSLFEKLGPVCKAFILENIRLIDYRDLARLTGANAEDIKAAVESIGIKLPVDKARAWSEIDVGSFKSLFDCARCQVQLNHNTFYVGVNNCRKCMEKNIKHWIETGIKIDLHLRRN